MRAYVWLTKIFGLWGNYPRVAHVVTLKIVMSKGREFSVEF
jgi:hypothetical protein